MQEESKLLAAAYARYSDDHSRDTSLEDQVRRCREVAARHGYSIPDELVFVDAAITGRSQGLARREGYQALMAAWDAGRFKALVVDEPSRLARDTLELAQLQRRVETTGVHLLTADGIDSHAPLWQLMMGITGTLAEHYVRELSHRVVRGMVGQLERGYSIATPPFGYRHVDEVSPSGERLGTRWVVDETQASIVRWIYDARMAGQSYVDIAAALNERGVPSSRRNNRRGLPPHWRPGRIHALLANTAYRGVFVWHGSTAARTKAHKSGTELGRTEYRRPELRIVEDRVWYACNDRGPGRIRGGRKHLVAGWVRCGACGAVLSVVGTKPAQLYCASCSEAKRVGVATDWMGYVSARAVIEVLRVVIPRLLGDEALGLFHERLRQRLSGEQPEVVAALERDAARLTRSCKRLAAALAHSDAADGILEVEYQKTRGRLVEVEQQIKVRRNAITKEGREAIRKQLAAVRPDQVVASLLENPVDLARTREVLRRLFPRVVLVERPKKFLAVFEVSMAQGEALANATGTEAVDTEPVTVRVRVTSGATRPTPWRAEILD